MFQKRVFVRPFDAKGLIINKQFVTGSNKYFLTAEFNAPQSSIPAPASKIYVGVIPVHHDSCIFTLKINEINPTMTFSLLASSHHRGCDDFWQWFSAFIHTHYCNRKRNPPNTGKLINFL